jgi:hypothetical protein
MRKLIFIGFIAVGAAVGMFVAFDGDWGLRIVMTIIGAVSGAAVGGGLTGMGSGEAAGRHATLVRHPSGTGMSLDEIARNYWRDEGHAPFSKPPNAEPDRHMLDPDRVG